MRVFRAINQDFEMGFDLSLNTNLEEVEIYSTPLTRSPLIIPSVKKLKIDNLMSLSIDETDKFITRDNKVEELEIINCGDVTEGILMDVANKMKSLRILNVRGGKVSAQARNMVRVRCTNLKECNFKVDGGS
jgi:hypothetical protein